MRRSASDSSYVLIEGPWQHRFVAAGGSRFHVAELGEGPLVLLLHGFPQFWWAWRHQLIAVAAAGYRVAAMDLRGYGASDKTPHGYDTMTSAADVATVIRSLGEPSATIVGHDWGGWIAWSMPDLEPRVTTAVASVSMPHPARMRSVVLRSPAQRRAVRWLGPQQVPFWPERYLTDRAYVERLLRGWAAPDATSAAPSSWPTEAELDRYVQALGIPFVAHSVAEYYRWLVRSQPRRDGRRFRTAISAQIRVPVLQVHGAEDRLILADSARGCDPFVSAAYRFELLPAGGHFLPEERPDDVTAILLDWLATLPTPPT